MSGTHVFYNGVHMQDCELINWEQSLDTDESNVGVRFTRIRVTVSSSLVKLQNEILDVDWASRMKTTNPSINSTGFTAPVDSGISGGLLTDLTQRIEHDLSQPRQDFLLWVNGTCNSPGSAIPQNNTSRTSSTRVIVAATGRIPAVASETISVGIGDNEFTTSPIPSAIIRRHVLDANLGPKVSNVSITEVSGGAFVKVTATFEICRVLYQADAADTIPGATVQFDAQKARGVIYNRWSIVDSTDNEGKVSHDISGKICVKDHRYKPNACRLFAFPFAFPFGRMINKSYTVAEDGLTLAYKYRFEHAGAAPPAYVRDYKATYTEGIGPGEGKSGAQRASMSIRVKGWWHRSTNNPADTMTEKQQKFFLLRGAYTILHSRLTGLNLHWDPLPGQRIAKVHLVDCQVIEEVGKPELELRVNAIYTEAEKGEFHLRLLNMGRPIQLPNYDPRWWPVDNEWGRMLAEDKLNPFFNTAALPYGASGTAAKSDYCDIYLQPPYSQRHTLPRLAGDTKNDAATDTAAWEWARLDGSIVSLGSEVSPGTPPPANTNPINQLSISAYVSMDLAGQEYPAQAEQRNSEEYTGISISQRQGFMYVQWDSEILTDNSYGKILLPLSKSREKIFQSSGSPSPENPRLAGKQTAVAVKLHAGMAKRVYSVTASRIGNHPDLPLPEAVIQRAFISGSVGNVMNTEHLLQAEFVKDGCTLMPDGCTKLYSVHVRWTYGLENAMVTESGDTLLPSMKSPILKSTFEQDSIADVRTVFKPNMIKA